MKKGFTLIEILITLTIVAALATIAVPSFFKARERAAANQAFTYLQAIRAGEKLYFTKNSTFVSCSGRNNIRTALGVEISEEMYTFSVTATATTFTATATRVTNGSVWVSIDQAGTFAASPAWPGYIDLP